MPKLSGSPRYVLVILRGTEILGVTTSESNSTAEFKRLKKKAKDFVLLSKHWTENSSVRLYFVLEPEQLSQATLITDLQITEWIEERKRKSSIDPTPQMLENGGSDATSG